VSFDVQTPVLFVEPNATVPTLEAEIAYNGTGRLRGRWEVVLPGYERPGTSDLFPNAPFPPQLPRRPARSVSTRSFSASMCFFRQQDVSCFPVRTSRVFRQRSRAHTSFCC